MKHKVTVRLNGTNENPWHKFGLTQNPFPQIAKAEYMRGMMQLNSLNGDPIKSPEDIRQRLAGCTEEFIELCVSQFKPGVIAMFDAVFDDGMK